ncbi:MAG: phage holin family protein [Verrucomicrobiaceae bacterium]|jgi:uncharacterized membrane protein YqjE|nr:phage holin family protein [Verrucomicrobiaceae bacterium]
MEAPPSASNGSEERPRVTGLLRAVALYVEARGRLLQIEGQEAGQRLAGTMGLFVMTTSCLVFGWLLALPPVVLLVAQAVGWHWSRVALAGAGLHLFLGILFLILLKLRLRRMRLFEETFNQFRRDREWLASSKND